MSAVASTESREVQEYADDVRAWLDDLPASDREELIDDLRQHLVEVAADAGDGPLSARLGPPAAYAAELRASAGLPPRPDTSPPVGGPNWTSGAVALAAALRRHPTTRATLEFVDELRPAWWAARAAVIVVATAVAGDMPSRLHVPIPRLLGSRLLTIVALGAAVPVSVAIGRHARAGRHRAASGVLSFIAIVATVFLAVAVVVAAQPRYVSQSDFVPQHFDSLRAEDGRPIFNIYPFAADGTPLDGVLLFDQDGVPITNVADETARGSLARTYPQGPDGRPLTNAYPQRVQIPVGPRGLMREDQRPVVSIPAVTTTTAPQPPAP